MLGQTRSLIMQRSIKKNDVFTNLTYKGEII